MNIKSLIYRTLIKTYKFLPIKARINTAIRNSDIPNDKFYRDFRFQGTFDVRIDQLNSFKIKSYGGHIENETFWKGLFKTWEPDTGWIWIELCKSCNMIMDIGANTGIYSLIAKTINPDSTVHAFEPSNNTFDKLIYNNKLNNFDINCHKVAVSNKCGTQTFYDVFDKNQTSASISPDKLKNWDEYQGQMNEYQVQTITLDVFTNVNQLKYLDLVKLDIEMHEPEVLEGFQAGISRFKPIIIIEVLSDSIAEALNDLIPSDYEIYHLTGPNEVAKKSKFEVIAWKWNYLIFPKSKKDVLINCSSVFE